MVCIAVETMRVTDKDGKEYEITYGVTNTHYHYVSEVQLISHGMFHSVHGYFGMELLDCVLKITQQ